MRKKNKLIYGVGKNDANYKISQIVDGAIAVCPFYVSWKHMLERAYSEKYHSWKPAYKNVWVCEEWLSFMNFKTWMEKQDWQGKQLDKDIITHGNKEYCPENCCFVSSEVNGVLNARNAMRGNYPQGVNKVGVKFRAEVNIYGKNKHLGMYDTPEEARGAYNKAKSLQIRRIAIKQKDPRVFDGLMRHAALFVANEHDMR